jgi:hypothetical protein
MNVDGAAPFLMTSAAVGTPYAECTAPDPTLLSAEPGHSQVALAWSDESADPYVVGYKVYYDQAGKAQLVADVGVTTSYVDTSLTNGLEYCYKVTSCYDGTCESGYSNILCATPENQGQTAPAAGVTEIETGIYIGKGKTKTFEAQSLITAGETVIIRTLVLDGSGQTVSNATVEIVIGGPETATLNSNPSDADGWAEASWQTQTPNRKGNGGTTPGIYTATTTNVTASGYTWDSVTTSTTFEIK